jgi:hypothetical protein
MGLSNGSGIVGERGPRRFGVIMWEDIFGDGISVGDVARDGGPDEVGESGYVVFGLMEKGFFLCITVAGDS